MHWIALQPQLDVPVTDLALVDAPAALAWWALQFTPLVAWVDGALVLEVSASERLFGGQAALMKLLCTKNKTKAFMEYAHGATSLVALGRLWCITAGAAVNPISTPAHASIPVGPDALPVQALAAARAHLPTLARLGVTTWGQLRALPRGALVRRFVAGLVDALDRAYGQRPEVYPWLTVPEVFDAPLELAAAVESAPALLFGARRLLAQLQVWLAARRQGVLALELLWELDARRTNALHVDAHHSGGAQGRLVLRTAQATQDMQHLQRLLGERLAQVVLPAPVLYLRLRTLQTQAMAGESFSLLVDDARVGDSLHQMLERVSARLGPTQVLCPALQADHRPECMQHWRPWAQFEEYALAFKKRAKSATSSADCVPKNNNPLADAVLRPTWLLANPLRLVVVDQCPQYQGPLTLLAGPQRLEAGWLEGAAACALRDYFVAHSAQAGLLWIYRERLNHDAGLGPGYANRVGKELAHAPLLWYLHGLYA